MAWTPAWETCPDACQAEDGGKSMSWSRTRARWLAVLILFGGLLAITSSYAQRQSRVAALAFRPQGVQLTGAGSTFVNPLMSKWIGRYRAAHAGTHINYQPIGSG